MEELESKSELRVEYVQLPVRVSSFSGLDRVGVVRSALTQFENGTFAEASILAEAMGRDDRISSAIETRINGLLGTSRLFTPQGDGRRKSIATEADESFKKFCPQAELASLLRWGLLEGIGIGEIVWEVGARRWTPRLKVWHPQFVQWRWDTRSYWIVTQNSYEEVLPGTGKWVVYSPGGYHRGWMRGLIRSLALPWLIRQWTYRDWARHSEVRGLGIKRAYVPASASEGDKKIFFNSLKTMASEGLVVLPTTKDGTKFDLDIIEAEADAHDGFDKLLNRCEASISITVLGQNLTTEVKGGSHAAAKVHNEIRGDYRKADATSLAEALVEQLYSAWAALNFGDAALAPMLAWETDPPADVLTIANGAKALGDAITSLRTAGVNVDGRRMAEEAGLPLLEGDVVPAEKPGDVAADEEPDSDGDGPATQLRVKLSAATKLKPGFVAGQVYADAVADVVVQEAVKTTRHDIAALQVEIAAATDYDDLRTRLLARYKTMDAGPLTELVEKATLLAELNGRFRVLEDL